MFVYNAKNTQVHESRDSIGQLPHSYKLDNIKVACFLQKPGFLKKKTEMGIQARDYVSCSS